MLRRMAQIPNPDYETACASGHPQFWVALCRLLRDFGRDDNWLHKQVPNALSTVQNWTKGTAPRVDRLPAIAAAFGMSDWQLLRLGHQEMDRLRREAIAASGDKEREMALVEALKALQPARRRIVIEAALAGEYTEPGRGDEPEEASNGG